MKHPSLTARKANLVSCHTCHLLSDSSKVLSDGKAVCPRCGDHLHPRKVNSLSRTWALLIAAFVCYIPANVLPMTITGALGNTQADTIMSGVIYFIHSGSFEIALVIFVASIFVPIMKMIILTFLLISVHYRIRWKPRDRTRLYRLTEMVGRWSMVDIYVVTLMVALIKLGALADLAAGPGAVYFAAVVILTMFAAQSFDPRLIWDAMEK
jgi:paraquat-inducible protein A